MRVNRRSSNEAAKGMAMSSRGTNGQVLRVSAQIRNRLVVDALSIKVEEMLPRYLLPTAAFQVSNTDTVLIL